MAAFTVTQRIDRRRLRSVAEACAGIVDVSHPKFPWRSRCTAYRVFVAEFFLQRTGAVQVANVYPAFMREYPSLKRLICAEREKVLRSLIPLGLTHRSHTFLDAVGVIGAKHRGRVPRSEEQLLALPGVGRYIARAIRCFALDEPVGVLDVNVARVLVRAFQGCPDPPQRPGTVAYLWNLSDSIAEVSDAPKVTEWGLLDLGREICRRNPDCSSCPIATRCLYRRTQAKS